MNTKVLFLAWRGKKADGQPWFPVGRLDVESDTSYRFRYIGGVQRAAKRAGFSPLPSFPELGKDYRSSKLFALFQNRIMKPARPDFEEYLRSLDLHNNANPIEILSANGGTRATDTFEVFPKPEKDAKGNFTCRFFLHSWRYSNELAQQRIDCLKEGEYLYLTLELTNPETGLAVQIQTTDYYMIGWAPRYLVDDLARAMVEGPVDYKAKVMRLIPQSARSKQRVLIEMSGRWNKHEPMSSPDFEPLVE